MGRYTERIGLPTGSSHLALVVGAGVLGSGIYAYVKSRSVPSLAGGSVLGLAFLGSGMLIAKGEDFVGHCAAAASSVGLLAVGFMRKNAGAKPIADKDTAATLAKTGKTSKVPTFMIVTGALSLCYQSFKAWQWRE